MSHSGPSVNFIRKYINAEEFNGLSLDQIMININFLWQQKQKRKMEKSLCNQVHKNKQSCMQDSTCAWVDKSSKREGYCRNSADADIISLLIKKNKINQASSLEEVRMAVYLYKKGLLSVCNQI
jgi:hypothetical protein